MEQLNRSSLGMAVEFDDETQVFKIEKVISLPNKEEVVHDMFDV